MTLKQFFDDTQRKINSIERRLNNFTAIGGQANTASNIGIGGIGLYQQKVGVDLQFRNINAASARVSVVLDAGNNEVDIDIVQAQIIHNSLGGLQGGQANQYYHLNALEHSFVSGINAQSVLTTASPYFVQLGLLDTGADHELYLKCNENLGADRILNLLVGDAARTITLSGNPTLNDWFDQSVKQASSPTFAGLTSSANIVFSGAWIRELKHSVDTQGAYIEGGDAVDHGASLQFFGDRHATYPGDCYIVSGSHDINPGSVIQFAYRDTGVYKAIMTLGADRHVDIYDWNDNAMREISFGADDSGGVGFKVLRVPN